MHPEVGDITIAESAGVSDGARMFYGGPAVGWQRRPRVGIRRVDSARTECDADERGGMAELLCATRTSVRTGRRMGFAEHFVFMAWITISTG